MTTQSEEADESAKTALNKPFCRELYRWLGSGAQAMTVSTPDDKTVLYNIEAVASRHEMHTAVWSSDSGWLGVNIDLSAEVDEFVKKHELGDVDPQLKTPINALKFVVGMGKLKQGVVMVMLNYHDYFGKDRNDDASHRARNTREVLHQIIKAEQLVSPSENWSLRPVIFLSHGDSITWHSEIKHRLIDIKFDPPDVDEILRGNIESLLEVNKSEFQNMPDARLKVAMARACLGLHRLEITNILTRVGSQRPGFDAESLKEIRKLKAALLLQSEVITPLLDTELKRADQVGGMDILVADVKLHALAYSPEARAAHIPLPSGIILMGIQGTGKSMFAKAAGAIFRDQLGEDFPAFRLDVGALFNKYVGESEAIWRRTKRLLKSLGPCVLFLDEVHDALKGMASNGPSGDSGVGKRVYADFKSWCQDRHDHGDESYLIMAMNNPTELADSSPELFRRVEEQYFVDFPGRAQRSQIFKIALRDQLGKIGMRLDDLNWQDAEFEALADATGEPAFTGDEIVKVVASSRRSAMARDLGSKGIPTFTELMQAIGIKKTSVISVVQRDATARLREACRNAKPATTPEVASLQSTPSAAAASKATVNPSRRKIRFNAGDEDSFN
jgi:hypothetical protein